MAASTHTTAPRATLGLPYCAPCQEPFRATVAGRFPQQFPCGHSACDSCAEASLLRNPPQCPICGSPCTSGTKPDVSLGAFAEALFAASTAANDFVTLCEDCKRDGDDASASHMCQSCGERLLCEDHGNLHANRKKHSVVPLGAARLPSTHCARHSSNGLTRFCFDDCAVICADCLLTEHNGHNVTPLAEAEAALRARVARVGTRCEAGSADAVAAHVSLTGARERMVARKSASIAKLEEDAAAAKAAIDASVLAVRTAADRELRARLKAIDAQLDSLSVAANHLACAGAVSRGLLSDSATTVLQLAQACESVERAAVLVVPYHGPCVSTVVEAVSSSEAVVRGLGAFARLRTGVHAGTSVASGGALTLFTPNTDNTVHFSLRDEAGAVVDSVAAADVVAWCSVPSPSTAAGVVVPATAGGAGGPARPASTAAAASAPPAAITGVTAAADGSISLSYTVTDPTIQQVRLGVNIAGTTAITGAPWTIASRAPVAAAVVTASVVPGAAPPRPGPVPCSIQNNITRRLLLSATPSDKTGMAVSADEKVMVVSDAAANAVIVYDLVANRVERVIAGGLLQGPGKLCFAPNGNVLVVEPACGRVQEVTLAGARVRTIAMPAPSAIDCNASTIFVGNTRGRGRAIELYDFVTGALMRSFGELGRASGQVAGGVTAIRASRDGSHVLVAESAKKRLSLYTVSGVFVKLCGGALVSCGGSSDVDFTAAGEIVVADYNTDELVVLGPEGQRQKARYPVPAPAGPHTALREHPTALAVRGRNVYLLLSSRSTVAVLQ